MLNRVDSDVTTSWTAMRPADRSLKNGGKLIYRIPALVRATHWIIALALLVLLLSGLQIFNAHPALYWGDVSYFNHPFLEVGAQDGGDGAPGGFVRVGGLRVGTTGFLGVVDDGSGQARAFPRWITLPKDQDLASGRRWHLFFAWVLTISIAAYAMANFIGRRFQRDLLPSRDQLRGIGRSISDHLRLRVPHGEEARHYNILQRLAYISIMLGVIPLVITTGLAMSPAIDAAVPWLPQVLGGRQTARSLHFFGTVILILFFGVHILMIVAAGPLNEMRSIITGWFAVRGTQTDGERKNRP